ncbi:uroporphyrinogen-III synthase [Tepidimonas sp.]|uniref:uroporphyrinogen-III synthase n=1 Tax=Tepidimonas sp. TaxID=2002775 RepID=UPI002FE1B9D5
MSAERASRPLVVVTRPADQAGAWVQGLRAAGWPVLALPLIDIVPAADPSALRAAVAGWADLDAAMFVSPAAVEALRQAAVPVPAPGLRCWAPGAGTVRALRDWGVAPAAIDHPPADAAQMDSEALWPVIAPQVHPGHRLLIVRGVSANGHAGRDWLLERCRGGGATVRTVVAYRRQPPTWDVIQRAKAGRAVADGAVWLFSSSEAVGHLRDLLPQAAWARARAIATHPRIAEAARALGYGEVRTCRPTLPDVVQALESSP